ncbi:Transposon Ty3-I Gag-Pol polyprotein [Gossypium australe]|uniref:Transposon Ty3-I Gag-Pol polyprotein n=1 Tax=Gossypium australe TaxID=47621 RepID=A0A5B6UXW3_9ROSI|nr:Transposon Ty3-I Gag-Pol polyprotein [Gossypium australe]
MLKQNHLVFPIRMSWKNNLNKLKEGHDNLFLSDFRSQSKIFNLKKFLDVLEQLGINIPLMEALEQILNYVKFMKDILSKKRKLGNFKLLRGSKHAYKVVRD